MLLFLSLSFTRSTNLSMNPIFPPEQWRLFDRFPPYGDAEIEYEENNGRWEKPNLLLVPLSLIDIQFGAAGPVQEKVHDNKEKIVHSKSVLPVRLKPITKGGRYPIQDGRHRCFVCQQLGFTHIPALVYEFSSLHPRHFYSLSNQTSYPTYKDPLGGHDLYLVQKEDYIMIRQKLDERTDWVACYDLEDQSWNVGEYHEEYEPYKDQLLEWIRTVIPSTTISSH